MAVTFNTRKLESAWQLLERWANEDRCRAIGAIVGSSNWQSEPHLFGRQTCAAEAMAVRDDAIFLIASPTKPLTAMAVMMLAESGALKVMDPVIRYVPEFGAGGKQRITLAQLLTHTSGLPDMLPENSELRAAQAPLSEFVSRTCALKADFPPGTAVQYQSMGYLMLGEVVARVTGEPLPAFLRRRLFDPLDMQDTALGMPPEWEEEIDGRIARRDRIAEVRLPQDSQHEIVWNGDYWRRLGAPWGGLLSTPADWARLCRHLLQIHAGGDGVLSPAALTAMTANQLAPMPDVPEINRRCYPWGFGWQLNWPSHPTSFGDFLSPSSYGHWGATGTMIWIDPARDAFAVLLTTQPLGTRRRFLAEFSNVVCSALKKKEEA